MKYTDENIPIECSVCNEVDWQNETGCAYGIKAMIQHILDVHPEYSKYEADVYATKWMDGMYDRLDLEEEAYAKDQAYERGLSRLRGKL